MYNRFETIILGCGYVGSYYLKNNPQTYFTKRTLDDNWKIPQKPIFFDLNETDSWKNIPNVQNVLWTFPAAKSQDEVEKCKQFYNSFLANKNVIILSSTSAYIPNFENEIINENSTLKLNETRFFAEEELRNKGALILHLSGIIGPNRSPLLWYKKNLVHDGKNILNYIHVKDIVFFIKMLFQNFNSSERYNLTSGDYKTHQLILNLLKEKLLIDKNYEFVNNIEYKNSKKVDNIKILERLNLKKYNFINYPENGEDLSND